MGMGILWSVTKPLLTQGYPSGKSLNLSVLFPHLQSGDSRHSHLLRLWVAETVMLNMLVSSVPVTHYLTKEAGRACFPLQTPEFTQGLSWLCEHRMYGAKRPKCG